MTKSVSERINRIEFSMFSDLFPELTKPRAQRRAIEILEAAIENYATIGIENTTYEKIAEACHITRPLLFHYYQDKDEIFSMAIKYIRVNVQNMAIEAIRAHSRADEMIRAYVQVIFDWVRRYPLHSKTWLLWLYSCSKNRKDRELNTAIVGAAHQRLVAILELGNQQEVFHCPEPAVAAKFIQTVITGLHVTLEGEKPALDLEIYKEALVDHCLQIAGARSRRLSQ